MAPRPLYHGPRTGEPLALKGILTVCVASLDAILERLGVPEVDQVAFRSSDIINERWLQAVEQERACRKNPRPLQCIGKLRQTTFCDFASRFMTYLRDADKPGTAFTKKLDEATQPAPVPSTPGFHTGGGFPFLPNTRLELKSVKCISNLFFPVDPQDEIPAIFYLANAYRKRQLPKDHVKFCRSTKAANRATYWAVADYLQKHEAPRKQSTSQLTKHRQLLTNQEGDHTDKGKDEEALDVDGRPPLADRLSTHHQYCQAARVSHRPAEQLLLFLNNLSRAEEHAANMRYLVDFLEMTLEAKEPAKTEAYLAALKDFVSSFPPSLRLMDVSTWENPVAYLARVKLWKKVMEEVDRTLGTNQCWLKLQAPSASSAFPLSTIRAIHCKLTEENASAIARNLILLCSALPQSDETALNTLENIGACLLPKVMMKEDLIFSDLNAYPCIARGNARVVKRSRARVDGQPDEDRNLSWFKLQVPKSSVLPDDLLTNITRQASEEKAAAVANNIMLLGTRPKGYSEDLLTLLEKDGTKIKLQPDDMEDNHSQTILNLRDFFEEKRQAEEKDREQSGIDDEPTFKHPLARALYEYISQKDSAIDDEIVKYEQARKSNILNPYVANDLLGSEVSVIIRLMLKNRGSIDENCEAWRKLCTKKNRIQGLLACPSCDLPSLSSGKSADNASFQLARRMRLWHKVLDQVALESTTDVTEVLSLLPPELISNLFEFVTKENMETLAKNMTDLCRLERGSLESFVRRMDEQRGWEKRGWMFEEGIASSPVRSPLQEEDTPLHASRRYKLWKRIQERVDKTLGNNRWFLRSSVLPCCFMRALYGLISNENASLVAQNLVILFTVPQGCDEALIELLSKDKIKLRPQDMVSASAIDSLRCLMVHKAFLRNFEPICRRLEVSESFSNDDLKNIEAFERMRIQAHNADFQAPSVITKFLAATIFKTAELLRSGPYSPEGIKTFVLSLKNFKPGVTLPTFADQSPDGEGWYSKILDCIYHWSQVVLRVNELKGNSTWQFIDNPDFTKRVTTLQLGVKSDNIEETAQLLSSMCAAN